MIKNNYKADLFKISILGVDGIVYAKQNLGECRTGKISIYCKMGKEPACKIGVYPDNYKLKDLKDYVSEELIEKDSL